MLPIIKSLFLLVCVLFALAKNSIAQESTPAAPVTSQSDEDKVPFGERIVFGGGLGLQFGDYTIVDVEPIIGYKFTPQLIGGVGIKYIYFKRKFFDINGNYAFTFATNVYGGSVFGRYYFIENVFAHVEYELLNLEEFNPILNDYERVNIPSFLVGGGYSQELGENASIGITVLYNLNDDINSPYSNPIIRVGFGFGF